MAPWLMERIAMPIATLTLMLDQILPQTQRGGTVLL
jgi:hypothetical protein